MMRRRRARAALLLPECTVDDKIAALQEEQIILAPYASTKTLPLLKARLTEIRQAIHRMRGLPLEEPDV